MSRWCFTPVDIEDHAGFVFQVRKAVRAYPSCSLTINPTQYGNHFRSQCAVRDLLMCRFVLLPLLGQDTNYIT